MGAKAGLTERQEKWFASVREGIERETGKSFDDWVAIARTCPETKHRARLTWFKETHGLGQNRASVIFAAAFEATPTGEKADELFEGLWKDAGQRAIYERIEKAVSALDGVTKGQRKAFTAFSRKVQFASARPVKDGGVRLGLAVSPDADPRLEPAKKNEGWSERLKATAVLTKPGDVDAGLKKLLKDAWSAS